MPWRGPEYEGEFPSLGWAVAEWIEAHCVVPDREDAGEPFVLSDEQLAFLVHHYRLKPEATEARWQTAWQYTRSLLVKPQKWGKAPITSAMICAEAVGDVLFAGWDAYGEPVARPWPTPIIQVTAYSEDQTDNIWKVLLPMIQMGPLADIIPDTGETRINLPGQGWVEPVTSKALSRLGARITFAPQDEVGTWVSPNMRYLADTQYRGLSGTGGRSMLTTNAWDLAENSVAQQIAEGGESTDYVDHVQAPENLSYANKRERHKIHEIVYGDSALKINRSGERVSGWVDLERIEIDAAKLARKDPNQAARFYGNRPTMGSGQWMPDGAWNDKLEVRDRPKSVPVCAGFDGSDKDDWTGIRLETFDRYQFTPVYHDGTRRAIWNPAVWPGHRIPRSEVMAAWDDIFANFDVVRAYLDPPLWGSEIAHLQGKYGEKIVIEWPTYRLNPMHAALEAFKTDITNPSSEFRHDDCDFTAQHIRNAVERARGVQTSLDGIRRQTYILGKASQTQKIDLAMSSALAHEAVNDAIAAGDLGKRPSANISTTFYGFS
jgi:hypothetical protein